MKFTRNAKIFRGQLDVAPFLGVFFLLVVFLLLGSLVYTPGVAIQLPESATSLPGTANPPLAIAVDRNGQLYFENQLIGEAALKTRLADAVKKAPDPLTLVVRADKAVPYAVVIRLAGLAREAGIKEVLWAYLPSVLSARSANANAP
jgi:biopolymer transport protein ExbD